MCSNSTWLPPNLWSAYLTPYSGLTGPSETGPWSGEKEFRDPGLQGDPGEETKTRVASDLSLWQKVRLLQSLQEQQSWSLFPKNEQQKGWKARKGQCQVGYHITEKVRVLWERTRAERQGEEPEGPPGMCRAEMCLYWTKDHWRWQHRSHPSNLPFRKPSSLLSNTSSYS